MFHNSIYRIPIAVFVIHLLELASFRFAGGSSRYVKKKDSVHEQVPDLDDMTGDGLVNGTKELVYDMDQLGL